MSKQNILKENGTFNKNHAKVKEQRFVSDDFFDPQDLVQVKYEMLRTANESKRGMDEVAGRFGFSRSAFYKIKTSFEEEGISAFVSRKSGPRSARKLTMEYQEFIDLYLLQNPKASSESIADVLKRERGLIISKRTVERYRSRKGKHY